MQKNPKNGMKSDIDCFQAIKETTTSAPVE